METIRRIAPAVALLAVLLITGWLAGCAAPTSRPGSAPTLHPASAEEIELVRYALITDVTTIQTSHRVVTMTTTASGQPSPESSAQFAADTRAPDSFYAQGNLNGKDFERLVIGGRWHHKDASGAWVQYTESDDSYMVLLLALNYPYELLQTNLPGAAKNAGTRSTTLIAAGSEELREGVHAQHFTWETSGEAEPGLRQRGVNEVWIDPQAQRAYKLRACAYREGASNKAPGEVCWSVVISKVNEPVPSLPSDTIP